MDWCKNNISVVVGVHYSPVQYDTQWNDKMLLTGENLWWVDHSWIRGAHQNHSIKLSPQLFWGQKVSEEACGSR